MINYYTEYPIHITQYLCNIRQSWMATFRTSKTLEGSVLLLRVVEKCMRGSVSFVLLYTYSSVRSLSLPIVPCWWEQLRFPSFLCHVALLSSFSGPVRLLQAKIVCSACSLLNLYCKYLAFLTLPLCLHGLKSIRLS